QFSPTVAGDVNGVVRLENRFLNGGDEIDVNRGCVQQRFAKPAAIGQFREIFLRQSLRQRSAERQAIGVNAGAGEHDYRVAVANVSFNSIRFWRDSPDRRAGK